MFLAILVCIINYKVWKYFNVIVHSLILVLILTGSIILYIHTRHIFIVARHLRKQIGSFNFLQNSLIVSGNVYFGMLCGK